MKNRFIAAAAILLFGAALSANAQDIIYTVDSRPIESRVVEIGEDYLYYKAFDNLDGPDYKMSISRITKIVFENGKVETFSEIASPLRQTPSPFAYGPIDYRWGHYYDPYGYYTTDQLANYIGVSLYGSRYRKARGQYLCGACLVGAGVAALAFGIPLIFVASASGSYAAEAGFSHDSTPGALAALGTLTGVACLGTGIPIWVSGNRKLNAIADDYNQKYGQRDFSSNGATLSVGPTRSGVGLALNF